MSERELLEMAAKAADYDVMRTMSGRIVVDFKTWDPLDDDGDAFRLAMSLEMTLCTHGMGVYANSGDLMCSSLECTDNDRPALVRRTIVRLAAKIGSLKP